MRENESETGWDLPGQPRWYNHESQPHDDRHSAVFPLAVQTIQNNVNAGYSC